MTTPEQIEHYAAGGQRLSLAIRGLTDADLAQPSEPGSWSIGHLVVHMADAELALADRMKRVIATDDASLLAWDENRFMAGLHYDKQSVEDAAALVDLTRRQTARILRELPPAAFDRTGVHSEAGRMTLSDLIARADKHLDHHLTFVAGKRERMGKLMW